ncbi:cytochrome c [Rhizobium sp. MC63]|uniref:Cytochrome c domain-containing protein n=5 Tax=Rhizobium TaxID=379 RepID=A0A1C3YA21_9HYPH|nr:MULTISPECIES: cytochrome c [Rhizobium]ANK88266.1 cytochrome-c domain-containing protein [Rhizobium sp. N731]ANL18512.1 cytochrome-c domain-containing protein [Rhizobium sp. N1314]ANL37102.1 cytochrome-c domain-containing protein [Rhizobium phaseoli]ANL43480.1 cytochrome-c domain-containing protein [Rhizobium phaseoli]ANL62466.1 cytochrome-c domain-containing protein [Rhizobium phaseoli]
MPISRDRLYRLFRFLLVSVNLLVLITLVATGIFIRLEGDWVHPTIRDPKDAFENGTIGTELMPLPVALVLPDLFPEHFQPAGADAGDWVKQFGFLPYDNPEANNGLPLGFATSNYRPGSAAPSPVPFVGFSCALCHTTRIRKSEESKGVVVYGPGSVSINLFAWIDAFQAAVLTRVKPQRDGETDMERPYRLTVDSICDSYRAKTGETLGSIQRLLIGLWLRQVRARIEAGLPRFDEPIGNYRSRDADVTPTGPTRTQPFRTLVRTVLDRPGNDMPVYTKIATVFSEDHRARAQFDGSIGDIYARSSLAALAAGATVTNMAKPEIADNIRKASDFTKTLRPLRYSDMFPEDAASIDPARILQGRKVYGQYCAACHGDRDSTGAWVNGEKTGQVVPAGELNTDPERVRFRHYGPLAEKMFALFPDKHPFHFKREDIWPQRGQEEETSIRGYVNAPLDGMFLRAPYLHNGSVMTLAELINLRKRRDVFYRGDNTYDPADVGFRSPESADDRNYFTFDTTQIGNSNRGHDYPWAYDDPKRNPDDLAALLDYLKML